MVLIPNDAGIRMRMQTEASLQPIAPVSEVPADLAEMRPGQTFSAKIQEVLPENTYKALVAGHSLTLALPQGAKAGDTLELVVVDRTPRLIVAHLASRGAAAETATGTSQPFTNLSPTAQLIGALLARDGTPPAPAALTPGRPLLPAASVDTAKLAAALAPELARAVAQSGLFYEAHQVQWVMGRRPLTDLLAEPQGKQPIVPAFPSGGKQPVEDDALRHASNPRAGERPIAPAMQNLPGHEEVRQQSNTASATSANPAQAVPEELRPLVQQQLDAAATQRLAWHGEVWPGQTLDWQIEPEQQGAGAEQADAEWAWATSLRLTTPRLGEMDAKLRLTPQGARITIVTPVDSSAADLLGAGPSLEKSMAAAGVPLLDLQVKHASGK